MLYESRTAPDFKVLTHTSTRRFQKNGFSQVGNTLVPKNEVSQSRVTPSAIYSKGIPTKFGVSGISEAGYGRRYPNPRGLSAYRGGGSYGQSGSRLGYHGAGSYGQSGSRLSYHGAGSYGEAGSSLSDAYINDNPNPAELAHIRLGGLSDDAPPVVEPSLFSTITSAFKNLTETTIKSGSTAANQAITNALNPPPKPPAPIVTTVTKAATTAASSMGMSVNTMLMGVALLLGGYLVVKKL